MLYCPNEKDRNHPKPIESEFVLQALIRVGAHYEFKWVQEHYLEHVLCRTCGAIAVDETE